MGKNIFSSQQYSTSDISKSVQAETSVQNDAQVFQTKDATSIFSDNKGFKTGGNEENSDNPLLKGITFGIAQGGLSATKKLSAQNNNVSSAQQSSQLSGGSSIFLGGGSNSTLQPSNTDKTSIFSKTNPIGNYAIYNKLDSTYKAHKLTEEEVASQKGLTGVKRTNPKPYNANYEIEENPYQAFRDMDPEFLKKPDALEMLNPANWFKKQNENY